jgi:hypothetical protein
LILRLGIFLPLPVYEAAYGGSSLLGIGWHPPGRCQLAAEWYGSALEAIQIGIDQNYFALCAAAKPPLNAEQFATAPACPDVYAFHSNEAIALG